MPTDGPHEGALQVPHNMTFPLTISGARNSLAAPVRRRLRGRPPPQPPAYPMAHHKSEPAEDSKEPSASLLAALITLGNRRGLSHAARPCDEPDTAASHPPPHRARLICPSRRGDWMLQRIFLPLV